MKYLLLTVDLEEFYVPKEMYNIDMPMKKMCEISEKGMENLARVLRKHKVKVTFFTTYMYAKHCENSLGRLLKEGHELALHAYVHGHNYRDMDQDKAYRYLREAKSKMESMFKKKIIGFRGTQMRRPRLEVLKKLGIKYDSSLHPTWVPGHYNNFFKPRKIFNEDGIIQVPVSVAPICRAHLSWLWFRVYPLIYSKFFGSMNFIDMDFLNIYIHPWEFIELDKYRVDWRIKMNTGKKNIEKLDKYLEWIMKKGVRSETISGYLKIK